MNTSNHNLETEINARLDVLDKFKHPVMTDDLAGRIVGSMARAHRRGRVWGRIVRIGFPVAAAAGLILAVSLLTSGYGKTRGNTAAGEAASMWALGGGSDTAEKIFAELDFNETATQPVGKSSTPKTENDPDQALIDAVCNS